MDYLHRPVFDGSDLVFSLRGSDVCSSDIFLAGVSYVIPKVFTSGHFGESLGFIAIFGVHGPMYWYTLSQLLNELKNLMELVLCK